MCFLKAFFLRSWQQNLSAKCNKWEQYSSLHCREILSNTKKCLSKYKTDKLLPYVLVTCGKLSKSVYRLLQLFLFGSSAVAKLQNIIKIGQYDKARSTSNRFTAGLNLGFLTVLFSMKLVKNSSMSARPSKKFSAISSDSSSAWWAATFKRACRALRLQL